MCVLLIPMLILIIETGSLKYPSTAFVLEAKQGDAVLEWSILSCMIHNTCLDQ
jgi:hypothetical protein